MAKRHDSATSERAAAFMVHQLRETSGQAIQALSQRIPLSDVYQAHVWATFDMLEMALRSRKMARGKMPPPPTAAPALKIAERVELFKEVMELISEELLSIDPSNEYAVALLQRRKAGKPKA